MRCKLCKIENQVAAVKRKYNVIYTFSFTKNIIGMKISTWLPFNGFPWHCSYRRR